MSFEPREYLRHILIEVEYLERESRAITRTQFLEDPTLRRSFVRALEVIGEATKKLPQDIRDRHPHIEWRGMAGMRDRLIHGYFGVDYELVWDVVSTKIPPLHSQIETILSSEDPD